MEENKIAVKPVNDLIGSHFFIPSYQRGYRWTTTQVTELLEDIWEFSEKDKSKDEYYCLQPVVVKADGNSWRVIDGQQRLTTIYLILKVLKKEDRFTIKYQTRNMSQEFLENLGEENVIEAVNIDFHFMATAFNLIKKWFDDKKFLDKKFTIKEEFSIALGKSTRVIWYEVGEGVLEKEIFTRLNIGKIKLTSAELIKALLLSSNNFKSDGSRTEHRQKEIASDWDRIEYALQGNEFWYFLNQGPNNVGTRIQFLFDIVAEKKSSSSQDDLFTFHAFDDRLKASKKDKQQIVEEIWKQVKDLFLTFEEWHQDRELFHLIGYLITTGKPIESIILESRDKIKSKFKEELRARIVQDIPEDIHVLSYEDKGDWAEIKKTLLLFNVITTLNEEKQSRFPFHRFKAEGSGVWSLEHIHARNSKGLNTLQQWKGWLKDHEEALIRIDTDKHRDLIADLGAKNNDRLTLEIFNQLFVRVLNIFKEEENVLEIHGIQNMALLDNASNSALNNSIFEVKRKIILDREKRGAFIPVCTRNVFLKYYSSSPTDLTYWTKTDRADYLRSIMNTFDNFIKNQAVIN